jgi:hypothetical protein
MHEPANIGSELLSFRARQYHTEIERVQETLLRDPALSLNQVTMHDGDLASRPAKAYKAQF